jgi:hypothetical protein
MLYPESWNPEDGDSMFLRNVGIYLRVHTVSQPRTTSSSSPPWELQISYISENVKTSIKSSPGYCELMQNKPWFDEELLKT